MKKNILVAVSGLNPQVISEAFYCLSKRKKIRIDEIYVITTGKGRDIIIGKGNYPQLKKEIKECCNENSFQIPKFENNEKHITVATEESLELYDIVNDKENKLFPNKICEVVFNLSQNTGNRLFCCISGGRKTMSVYMAFALSLFGGLNDRLIHVITKEEHQSKNFYPKSRKEDKELTIAEIPFIRVNKYLKESVKKGRIRKLNYENIVRFAQNEISPEDEFKMFLKTKTNELIFANNEPVKLQRKEFEMYLHFIEEKFNGIETFSKYDLKDLYFKTSRKGIENVLSRITRTNNIIRKAVKNPDIQKYYFISGPRELGVQEHYGILREAKYFEII